MVWASLAEEMLRKRIGRLRIGPVNPFSPRGSPLTSKLNCLTLDRVQYNNKGDSFGWSGRGKVKLFQVNVSSKGPSSKRAYMYV